MAIASQICQKISDYVWSTFGTPVTSISYFLNSKIISIYLWQLNTATNKICKTKIHWFFLWFFGYGIQFPLLQIVPASAIPDGWMGLDIGPDSTKTFNEALDTTETIIWNGPMGVFEFEKFAAGTEVNMIYWITFHNTEITKHSVLKPKVTLPNRQ